MILDRRARLLATSALGFPGSQSPGVYLMADASRPGAAAFFMPLEAVNAQVDKLTGRAR